jgi:hypothetical protein
VRSRAGLTRWEFALAVLLLGAVAAFWAPRVRVTILRSRRAEVGMVLESLQAWAEAHPGGTFGPMPRTPAGVGQDRVPWAGAPAGWSPPTETARGSYFTERGVEGLVLVGVCDVDGDGVAARYVATPSGAIRLTTPPDVY